MVKVGFIVEGETEKIMIDSTGFRAWCHQIGVEICEPVIDAKGSGNLLPSRIKNYLNQIRKALPNKVVVLTDLEEEESIEAVRSRIQSDALDVVFIAVKAVESWFLADSDALARWLGIENVQEENPEQTPAMPWDYLRDIAKKYNARGTGPSKPVFAKKYTGRFGFSIEKAATHPNCPSVKYFHDTLIKFGNSMKEKV